MAFFTNNNIVHQEKLFSIPLCKYPSALNTFKFHFSFHILTFSPHKHSFTPKICPLFVASSHINHINAKLSTTGYDYEPSTKAVNFRTSGENFSGYLSFRSGNDGVGRNSVELASISLLEKGEMKKRNADGRDTKERLDSRNSREMGSGSPSMKSKHANLGIKTVENKSNTLVVGKINKNLSKDDEIIKAKVGEERVQKGSKNSKAESPRAQLSVALDMCSKKGDVKGAIDLYDAARREGIKLGQYHYAVLLYLCSSAALGVVHPAKSGSISRSLSFNVLDSNLNSVDYGEYRNTGRRNLNGVKSNIPHSDCGLVTELDENMKDLNSYSIPVKVPKEDIGRNSNEKNTLTPFSSKLRGENPEFNGLEYLRKGDNDFANLKEGNDDQENNEIVVNGDIKKYALEKGFEIYETMRSEKIPMNEATLTSVARMAMSMGDGDMAFDMVKQMKALGINPRLRSYGPALSAFCSSGDIEKAFAVEKHMLEHGVCTEEPELEALLRVSIEAGKSEKVYYLLHKLRASVRKVSPSTAVLIEKWFKSKEASRVGKRKWDKRLIREAIENGGGGWHGKGWLGRGRWTVSHTAVGDDGFCKYCGENLATIDLDPTETENFAESVASIATKRERNSSFQKFQKWLEYYGPFEAVVDAANVGLFSQRRFKPSRINAVVNGVRQMLPSKKWPLIILHNRRITGHKMDEPINKALIEKWRNADALYATPTGSNDDWYWLYAAIKFKCLIVTNDEMRDHTFQLLGNEFFPKWKERHQVHFSFSDAGPVFRMPPPCSVVIQESESGRWHIPIASEDDSEGERTSWLCITRAMSHKEKQSSTTSPEGLDTQTDVQRNQPSMTHGNQRATRKQPRETYRKLRNILSATLLSNRPTVLSEIEAAEVIGNSTVDFQI